MSAAAFLVVVIAFAMLFEINRLIRDKIDALATANSDSVQWSLAQSDVELLALKAAISDAIAHPMDPISAVRTRFDVFYSRARTLATSPLFQEVRDDPETVEALNSIENYLAQSVELIDSDDETLRAELPRLGAMTSAVRVDVRNINMKGLNVLSRASDDQRTQTADTLNLSAIMILMFFLIMLVMLGLLVYLFRKSQQRAIEQSQMRARLAAIVSSSLDAVIAVSKTGAIVDFNGAAEQIFGYARDEVIGHQMEDIIVPDHLKEAHRNGMERYRSTGEKHVIGKGRVQLEARKKNGEVFPVELSIEHAESEEGEIFVSFLRDISGRVAAQQELVKARDDAVAGEKAKADLIAVMSHEMRTPLNGMLGALQLIEPENLSRKDREYIDIIGASSKLLLHHVDNVLEISRAEAGKMEVLNTIFSLPELITELVESQRGVAEHRGNTLAKSVEPGSSDYAYGDSTRIRQILLNLIGNAVKFTRNGSITVDAKRIQETELVEFRVTDTGIGIAKKDRVRVFEEFVTLDASYSREVGGTGLGLAIVKRLVEAMGGEVGLDSSDGFGSSFWARLPLPMKQDEEMIELEECAEETSGPEKSNLPSMKILVVEDNQINRIVMRDLLEKDGHQVDEAMDGRQGLECALAKDYDLILMDVSMPIMDGLEATKEIRQAEVTDPHVPIIAVTAHAMPSEKERFLAAGMDDTVTKPVSLRNLRKILKDVSDRDGQAREHASHTASIQSQPTVDHAQIDELTSALGAEKAAALVSQFLSEMQNDITDIVRKLEARQFEEPLREQVHHAAGSAAMLGAEMLRTRLCELEDQLSGELSESEATSTGLQSIWERTARELQSRVQTQ